jgi:hypothetical protein
MTLRSYLSIAAAFLAGVAVTYLAMRDGDLGTSAETQTQARPAPGAAVESPAPARSERSAIEPSGAESGAHDALAAAPSTSPAAGDYEDYKDIDKETDPERIRWRTMRMALQEYRKIEHKNSRGADERSLLDFTLATILHEQRRGEVPDMKKRLREKKNDEYYMICNGEAYLFSAQEFPEYTNWVEYNRSSDAYAAAVREKTPWSGPIPYFEDNSFVWLEQLAADTLAKFTKDHPECKPPNK